jgi:ABC-2 type transport system permease protein
MKFWEIGKRNLKEIYRNPVLLGFLLGMPVAFMLVFVAATGAGQANPIALSVVDEDSSENSTAFIQYIGGVDAIELNEPIYSEESEAQEDLDEGKISFYLLIPSGFQAAQQTQQTINLQLIHKTADPMTGLQLKPIIEAVGSAFLGVAPPLNVELKGTEIRIKNPAVNFYAPGIAVYGLMILISTAAETFGFHSGLFFALYPRAHRLHTDLSWRGNGTGLDCRRQSRSCLPYLLSCRALRYRDRHDSR